MRLVDVKRSEVENLLNGDTLRGGKMLQVTWPRLTDKRVKGEDGKTKIVQPKGTMITRRVILRSDWKKSTKTFTPKGGKMFNLADNAKVKEVRAINALYLFLSLEGVTHPQGEKDHPVNVPVKHLVEIQDTHDKVIYRVLED